VRIERGQHAVDGALDQGVVVDRLDIVGLDLLVDGRAWNCGPVRESTAARPAVATGRTATAVTSAVARSREASGLAMGKSDFPCVER
jgi:hypothetical protein